MNVPQQTTVATLTRLVAGSPANAVNHVRQNDDLAFLTSYAVQPVFSQILPSISTTPHFHQIAYTKTPGTKAISITVEPNVATSGTRPSLKLTVTSSAGTVNWIETGVGFFHDGSYDMPCQVPFTREYPQYSAHLDVSQLTDDTTYDLKFNVSDTSGTAGVSRGLYRVTITEVPLADTDPVGAPTTETGVSPAWLVNTERNRIVDGDDTTTSYGTQRLQNQLEIARYQKRRQIQIVKAEATALAWNVTAVSGGGAVTSAFPFGYTGAPTFRVRARAVYGTSTANLYVLRLRYQNSGANKLRFRVAVTPVDGATTNTTYTLANQAAFAAKTTDNTAATMAISIPATGTDQECDLAFYADNDVAGTSQVSQILLLEAEA